MKLNTVKLNTVKRRRRERRSDRRLLLSVVLLVAFALRCASLDHQELRGDEAFGYFFSLQPLDEIARQTLALHEPHPVASYWLQHGWLAVAGHSEFALRFPGVWWSVLSTALIVLLAAHLRLPRSSGNVAALLMALNPYVIWHAQDARMYSMSLALTLASTICAVGWWRSDGQRRQTGYAVAYLVVTWLALHTHYFALYVVAAQHIALLGWAVRAQTWGRLLRWWGISVVLVLVWLPWLWVAQATLTGYSGNGDSPALVDALWRALSAFGGGESFDMGWRVGVTALVLVAAGIGGWGLWQRSIEGGRAALWLLLVYGLTPLVATWASARNRPIFNERYLVAAVPPVLLLVAAAALPLTVPKWPRWTTWLGRAVTGLVLAGMVGGLVWQGVTADFTKTRGWRELAAALGELAAGVDAAEVRLVENYPDPTLWYYYQGEVPHLVLPPAAHDAEGAAREVSQMVDAGVTRVLLVEQPSDAWDNRGLARAALDKAFTYAGQTIVAQWPVSIWLRPPATLSPAAIEYAGGLQLTATGVVPEAVAPGGLISVYLQWQGAAENVAAQEAVSVQLLNGAGVLVAQSDRPLVMESDTTAQVTSYVILVPKDAAPDLYSIVVAVYDPGQAGAPRRLTTDGRDAVVIGTVQISPVQIEPGADSQY